MGGMEERNPPRDPAALGYPVATLLKVRARRSPILARGVIGTFSLDLFSKGRVDTPGPADLRLQNVAAFRNSTKPPILTGRFLNLLS